MTNEISSDDDKNVLSFPASRIVRKQPAIDSEEGKMLRHRTNVNYADSVIDEVGLTILDELSTFGIELDIENSEPKDFSFLMEVLSAVIYRNLGLKHKLHDFIDKNMSYIETAAPDSPTSNNSNTVS